jgi:hypothetical protein
VRPDVAPAVWRAARQRRHSGGARAACDKGHRGLRWRPPRRLHGCGLLRPWRRLPLLLPRGRPPGGGRRFRRPGTPLRVPAPGRRRLVAGCRPRPHAATAAAQHRRPAPGRPFGLPRGGWASRVQVLGRRPGQLSRLVHSRTRSSPNAVLGPWPPRHRFPVPPARLEHSAMGHGFGFRARLVVGGSNGGAPAGNSPRTGHRAAAERQTAAQTAGPAVGIRQH